MSIDLDELERLQKLAEPLPWKEDLYLTSDGDSVDAVSNNDGDMIVHTDESLLAEAFNCAYIVAACNSLPDLIAENRALRERVAETEEEGRTLGERLCETEHDLTEALDKKEELEGRIAELTQENSNQKRVIQMLEYRVLALKGKPIPMEPRSFIPSSNRSNAKEAVQEAEK